MKMPAPEGKQGRRGKGALDYLALGWALAAGACVVLLGTRSSGETMPHPVDPLAPAKVALGERDFARAENLLENLLQADSKNVPARLLLGRALHGQGRLAASRETFSAILQEEKNNGEAVRGLAEIFDALNQPGLAAAWWQRAAALDKGKNAEIHKRLAQALLKKDDFAGAMAALQQARSIDPKREDVEALFQEILTAQTAPGSPTGGPPPGASFPPRSQAPDPRTFGPIPQPPDPAKHFPRPGGISR